MAVKGDTLNVFSACAGGFACRKHVTITFMSSHQSLQEFTGLNLQSMVMTKILFIFRTISASSSFHKETQEFCSKNQAVICERNAKWCFCRVRIVTVNILPRGP